MPNHTLLCSKEVEHWTHCWNSRICCTRNRRGSIPSPSKDTNNKYIFPIAIHTSCITFKSMNQYLVMGTWALQAMTLLMTMMPSSTVSLLHWLCDVVTLDSIINITASIITHSSNIHLYFYSIFELWTSAKINQFYRKSISILPSKTWLLIEV